MASYSYYNTLPSWGTSQFQPIPPPTPRYRPLSSWTGNDYFTAHSGTRDNTVFDYVWYKMRDFVMGTGYGRNQAFHWWKRIYSGLVAPASVLPKEIGAAAGYEAIRVWETHSAIYAAPMNADREREREALVGLAAGEATRLWAYTGRPYDKWGRLEASETAAATASRIFIQTYNYESPSESYNRFPRLGSVSRRNTLGRRRALTPNPSSAGLRYRPPTPYNGPSVVDTLASPASSYGGGNSLNMSGMDGALPPLMSPSPAFAAPLGSPYLGGRAQGYIPSPVDDFQDDFNGFDDYEGGSGYESYGGNFGGYGNTGYGNSGYGNSGYGNSGYAGGSGGSAYGGYGGMGGRMRGMRGGMRGGMGGVGMDDFGGAGAGLVSPGLGYGGGALGSELDNSVGFLNSGGGSYGGSNVVYDPVLGPGIQGTYYPKVAQMQRLGLNGVGGYDYPGASVGLPPPPGTYSSGPRRGLRRSRSFF